MSTVKSKKLQVGTDATSSNNFTIYQPATPDGTLRIGVGNADSPTEVGRITADGLRQNGFYGFKAYLSSTQSISHTINTKINFDTIGSVQGYSTVGSAYSTTNKRFTPTVEGYYQVNANVHMGSGVNGQLAYPLLYKNGTNIMYGNVIYIGAAGSILSTFSGAVYLNGSTDYIEMYWYQNAGGARSLTANEVLTFWQAHLIAQT